MTDTHIERVGTLRHYNLPRLADWLAVAVAVSLPWSTTATGILVAAWLIVALLTIDVAAVRRELATAAGGLPVLLWAFAAVGMLWADVSWGERLAGFGPFNRLLLIPVLLAQFRRSEFGMHVLLGFLVSATAVLIYSWLLVLFPALPSGTPGGSGVPVKDYILQSSEFLICGCALFAPAFDATRSRRWALVMGLISLAFLFFANIAFVATARATLLVAAAFVLLLGWRFGWRGLLGGAFLFAFFALAILTESSYLHARLDRSVSELHDYETKGAVNSTSQHLELIKKSISIVRTAAVLGHGTGSITQEFRNAAIGKTGISAIAGPNPHNQILNVAIQLGLVGAILLLAMWSAHFMLFYGPSFAAWVGLLVVTDNIVSSLFSSHLFDFTQAWLYVFGVGVVGGMELRGQKHATTQHEARNFAASAHGR